MATRIVRERWHKARVALEEHHGSPVLLLSVQAQLNCVKVHYRMGGESHRASINDQTWEVE